MIEIIRELEEAKVGKVAQNEPLSKHTMWKIGGPADIFIEPDSVDGVIQTMEVIKRHNLPWRAIGRGSNLLVDDAGIAGAVLKFGPKLSHLELDGNIVKVGAGYSIIKLANVISKEGLTGLEFAGGIPGTIGGAVFMNAGAHGSEIANILTEAHILFPDGRLEWIKNKEMEFSYRTSRLQKERGVCIEAALEVKPGNKEEIIQEMMKHKRYRRETQPWNRPCAGSVFRNPLPDHAGALIEKSGLKGYRVGDAQISELHGNFIVNLGEAKAADVLAIIRHVQDTIHERYGVEMRTEVEIVKREA
ncbi:UDP-N-acetylmuramate dehydrogenase [Bacillus piscicola]|uniref:UDP-N-acetylmuramate dehydrogenase n=1 Tax=Bacillus piscicola TaxID=1632684 RepID=UPI001F09E8F6|nr:UDP-N-acetylmuramate dehydrogenase [Bacillus piscicola]